MDNRLMDNRLHLPFELAFLDAGPPSTLGHAAHLGVLRYEFGITRGMARPLIRADVDSAAGDSLALVVSTRRAQVPRINSRRP